MGFKQSPFPMVEGTKGHEKAVAKFIDMAMSAGGEAAAGSVDVASDIGTDEISKIPSIGTQKMEVEGTEIPDKIEKPEEKKEEDTKEEEETKEEETKGGGGKSKDVDRSGAFGGKIHQTR